MYTVEVKVNYSNDELYCVECKNRINLGEKYLNIVDELSDGTVEKSANHLDCIPETFDEDEDELFFGRT